MEWRPIVSSDTLELGKKERLTLVIDDLVNFTSGESREKVLGLLVL
jgi:hypothetical protein